MEGALHICREHGSGCVTPDNFYSFAGYCEWGRGELEEETGNGKWIALSVDAESILEKLDRQGKETAEEQSNHYRHQLVLPDRPVLPERIMGIPETFCVKHFSFV